MNSKGKQVIGRRLRLLRQARGWTLEFLAAQMGGLVTKQALSKYEKDLARPSMVVLNELASALGVKSVDLWREPAVAVSFVAYRQRCGLGRRERAEVEAFVERQLEERVRLQELTQQSDGSKVPVQELGANSVEAAEQAADKLREAWSLGPGPMASVTSVLEDRFVHVLEVEAPEKFDGISAVARSQSDQVVAAAVVTRRNVPGERQRLSLAHELGHLVLRPGRGDDGEREKRAFRFGAAFLAPASAVRAAIGQRRTFVQLEELLMLKRRFGLSLQALLYRLRDLGIISEHYYREWCVQVNRQGWRRREPLELPREQPQWFRLNVMRAQAEGLLAKEEAESLLGRAVPKEEPLTLVERRAFLRLAPEERRKQLAAQAERAAALYERDSTWRSWESASLDEST
jgi:Zn-dependent peptidase ImmA (M78 family)/transcriptional regulator with XRE-family HTH domain